MYGYDTVGSWYSSIANALNPVNQIKAAWGIASNPLNPLKQTQAIRNLFGGSRPAAAPPQMQYLPPGAYPPPAQQWGGVPPGYPPPAYAPPSGMPPTPAGFAPPPSYGAPPMFDYAAPMPVDVNALYGPQTGWDQAYGGSEAPGYW